MTLYAIFDPKPGRPDLPSVVPEGFSLSAALVPPVFLLRHGLWLETLLWLVLVVGLAALAPAIGVSFWLYVLAAVWLGFAAPGLRRHALQSRGWRLRGERVASSADLAQLEAMQ